MNDHGLLSDVVHKILWCCEKPLEQGLSFFRLDRQIFMDGARVKMFVKSTAVPSPHSPVRHVW